ncbi:MAG TPA: cytochrome c3 family protein [Geobacteraceae bacterium]|nr:cytochrome c3 family protein [Geobacteraceae bacterium]
MAFGRPLVASCVAVMVTGILVSIADTSGSAPVNSCLACHADGKKMAGLGYPHLTVTQAEVEKQAGMPASCHDCHLGDPTRTDREKAHMGMGRLLVVRKKGILAEPVERRYPLEVAVRGTPPLVSLTYYAEKDGKKAVDPTVRMITYQDKERDTLTQDFPVMEKTCGSCHPGEVAGFRQSAMGNNARHRLYRSWDDPERGPHNCGVWFSENYERIAAGTVVPFDRTTSALDQRSCNTCHAGCLDCHYAPAPPEAGNPKKGMHSFVRTPPPQSCYGGGRGTICHAGPEERRRGAGYFGGQYSFPEGTEPDRHRLNNVGCLDCHDSGKGKGHAMIARRATCTKCHAEAVSSHAQSAHKTLSCEACHIRNVGGYQGTFWGPGKLGGAATPYNKFNDYYGVMREPILIRDQDGRWIPVKPFPMAVMNQKSSRLTPGLHWRYPDSLPGLERTGDAYGYVGLFDTLPENNKALLWLHMDKVSHKYGKSRSCDSCHAPPDGEQRQDVSWEYGGDGALPFRGKHTVVANGQGLFIRGIRSTEEIEVEEGYRLSSFAPWVYLRDAWKIAGDFSLPRLRDRARYDAAQGDPALARKVGLVHR